MDTGDIEGTFTVMILSGALKARDRTIATLESENASLRKKVEELTVALTAQGAEQKPVAWELVWPGHESARRVTADESLKAAWEQGYADGAIVRPLFAAPVALHDKIGGR